MYKGDTRARTVEVYVDGVLVTTWTSSGTTVGFESIDLSGTSGSVIDVVGVLGDSEWLSIIEVSLATPFKQSSGVRRKCTWNPICTACHLLLLLLCFWQQKTNCGAFSLANHACPFRQVEILVLENDGTATPAPSPTAGTVLQPVGLTPLAIGDGSILDRFAVKVRSRSFRSIVTCALPCVMYSWFD